MISLGTAAVVGMAWMAASPPMEAALQEAVAKADGRPTGFAWVMADLRQTLDLSLASLKRKAGVAAVDRFLNRDGSGSDWLQTTQDWLDRFVPTGGPVPVHFTVGGTADAPWALLSIKATEGVVQRVQEGLQDWIAFEGRDGGAACADTEAAPLCMAFRSGWLRVWAGPSEPSVEKTGLSFGLAPDRLERAHTLVVWDGTSPLARTAREQTEDEDLKNFLTVRRLVFVQGTADPVTHWARVMVDHPQLAMVAPLLSDGVDRPGSFTTWGPEVRATLDLAIPAGWLQTGLLALQQDEDVRALVQGLDGRLSLAFFEGFADWAISVGFESSEAAGRAVPALEKLADRMGDAVNADLSRWVDGTEEGRWALRPAPDLAGLMFTTVADRVVLHSQEKRKFSTEAKGKDLRTPAVRELLEQPGLLSASFIPGFDPAFYTLYQWAAGALALLPMGAFGASEMEELVPPRLIDLMGPILAELPYMLALSEVQAMFIYDMALRVDVQDSQLILDLATSEI